MLDEAVPLQADAPMLMITERVAPFLTPVLGAAGRKLSFKQFANGTILIGGGHLGQAFPDANVAETRLGGLRESARTVVALFPQLRGARIVRAWAGIEGVTPDGIPVLGPGAAEGVFHSFGYSYHGFQLSPVTGQIIADLVLRGATKLPVEAFRAGRFDGP
jgi:sarcosine oxidase subunit beta